MRKLILLTLVISAVTLVGFLASRKVCSMMQCPMGMPSDSFKDKEVRGLCAQVCAGRMEVMRLLKNPNTQLPDIDRKIEEAGQLQISIEKRIARHIFKMKNRLTPQESQAYLGRIEKELKNSSQTVSS